MNFLHPAVWAALWSIDLGGFADRLDMLLKRGDTGYNSLHGLVSMLSWWLFALPTIAEMFQPSFPFRYPALTQGIVRSSPSKFAGFASYLNPEYGRT